ncbi:MAG: hypothetical protein EOO57_00935 [Hymenobacter sp.]|nr:MAG: hypothetical protein EOO57_00935 [Hymenobacter sp.]
MRTFLPKILALLAWGTYGGAALAQTPTLEFAAGAGNPTGNGPSIANQVITFQNNTDNPTTSNTFATYTPTLTATFALSNQQYTNNQYSSTGMGVTFGAGNNANGTSASALALFPLINLLSGTGNTSSLYTSANATSGGIDVTVNRSVELTTDVMVLPTPVPANQRYQYADLTITFNRPVVNPVVHLTGLGGSFAFTNNNTTTTNGFTSELDLLTSGITLSKLSGSSELTVSATGGASNLGQITNPTTNPGANTGSGAASGSVLVSTPAAGITTLQFRVYLRPLAAGGQIHDTNTHAGDGWLIGVSELTPLTGYVFEDVNYGGGSGRPSTASGAVVRPGATVELYNSSGTLVGTTTTDATGQYSFSVLPATYTVRVVNSTVTSSRTGYAAGLLPVQTYNGTSTRVGGENPKYTDAAANSGSQTLAALSSGTVTPESIASVTVGGSTGNTTGPDFGYNFDTVVNTNDTGQGSLRQFITNANALGAEASLAQAGSNTTGALPTGAETSIFMIPSGGAVAGLLASNNGGPASQLTSAGVASIAPATALPTITGANTTIDGSTQTQNIGNTNNVTLGTGGAVGTAGTALVQLNGREVQLVGSRGTYDGLTVNAGTVTVRSLSIYGFANDISVSTDVTNTLIERNVLGASAASFTDPGANARSTGQGVYLNNSDNGTVRNNLIGFSGGMGIWVYGDNNGANNNTISGNELRGNGQEVNVNGEGLAFDGLELQGASTGNTVSGNLITASLGNGIDNFGNTVGGNTITGNTISNNGVGIVNGTGQEGSGIRLYAATNLTTVSNNVLSGNNGSGVLLENAAAKVTISRNSTFGNTRLGIDLLSNADANTTATTYNGNTGSTSNVTLNSATTTGANALANYPVITAATISGTNLIVTGYAKSQAAIELFIAQPNTSTAASPNNLFGQGKTYLTTVTEGTSDNDSRTGLTYTGNVNGFNQGSDTNANGFSFTIALTTAQQALVTAGVKLTATSTLSNATSEFSGIVNVNTAPVPNTLTNANIPNTNGATVLSPNLSGAANGTANGATNTISYYTLTSLPSSGTLTYNGTVLTSSNIAATQLTPALLNKLTYTPAAGFSGNVSFTYTATDANGVVSTTNNNGGTVASGPATYTIPIGIADVTVSLGGQTTLNAGQPTSPITATFTNEGPSTATNVTRTVALPTGATVTGLQQAAILPAHF